MCLLLTLISLGIHQILHCPHEEMVLLALVKSFYCIPINDTFELFVFWPFDTESLINKLRFSESVSLSFKKRLTSVICFFVAT